MDVSIQFIWVQAKEYDLLGHSKGMFSFFFKLVHFFGCAVCSLSYTGFLHLGQVEDTLFVLVRALALRWLLLLQSMGSGLAGLRSCSTGLVVAAHGLRCSVACGILPRPSIEAMSPTLACKFLTTRPPGKSSKTLPSVVAAKNHLAFPAATGQNPVTPCLCQHLVSSVFWSFAK